ncbi:MAG: ABC transporter permease [Bacteroidaceae bacterium]
MYTWLMARRIFSHQDDSGKVSRPAIRISTIGVAIGVAVMLVSVSVALGFQHEVQAKLLGFGAHIQVFSYESLGSEEMKPIVIDSDITERIGRIPGVRHVQRFCVKPGMLKTEEAFRGVVFRGVGQEYDTTFLSEHLVAGEIPLLTDSVSSGKLLISQQLARQLQLEVGSSVYAYFFENSIKARRFRISGIYCTHLADFDNQIVFADLHTVHGLLNWDTNQVSGAEVLTDDINRLEEVRGAVVKSIHKQQDAYGAQYTSMTIHELYPQVFAWLHLLDMDVWIILILMTCVAGFTMISGLLIIILERTNFIGVMKAMGATNAEMRQLFLHYAVFIVLRGMLYGNLLAFALLFLQYFTGLVHLDPNVYYVDSVPVLFCWFYFLLVNIFTLISCVLALILPSYIISSIHPARSIRFE